MKIISYFYEWNPLQRDLQNINFVATTPPLPPIPFLLSISSSIQQAASGTSALDLGYQPQPGAAKSAKFVYLLNADDIPSSSSSVIASDAFVVYQGHHGDNGAHLADVILPGAAYTEKTATYVNTEGRAQVTRAAVPAPGAAREDWKIVRALSQVTAASAATAAAATTSFSSKKSVSLTSVLPYDDVAQLRLRMAEVGEGVLVEYDTLSPVSPDIVRKGLKSMATAAVSSSSKKGAAAASAPFELTVKDFYMTDPISRASRTMAKCSQVYQKKRIVFLSVSFSPSAI